MPKNAQSVPFDAVRATVTESGNGEIHLEVDSSYVVYPPKGFKVLVLWLPTTAKWNQVKKSDAT